MAASEDEESLLPLSGTKEDLRSSQKPYDRRRPKSDLMVAILIGMVMSFILLFSMIYFKLFLSNGSASALLAAVPCDTVLDGYQCDVWLSHTWGQYSPYYLVASEIPPRVPTGCEVKFVQLLSRHGARYPTADKSALYNSTLARIKSSATNLTGSNKFLADYVYDLGADALTSFGMQELINSGIDFFMRYEALAQENTPFIRASNQGRVVESSEKWGEGFHKAKMASGATNDSSFPYSIVKISEEAGMNNTLDHGLCPAFEAATTGRHAQEVFAETFAPQITSRLKQDLGMSDIVDAETIMLMDLCPYTVVAETKLYHDDHLDSRSVDKDPSDPFCALFTDAEWESYDYYQTLGKYYGHGPGSPLGPTQGIGFVNELIARLTSSPVQGHTSVNRTLDSDPATFPLGKAIYADFSHDNDMTAIFAALGLYSQIPMLSKTAIVSEDEMHGYSASRTVPFGGRMILEKLQCGAGSDEMVRVVMNGRVLPLQMCEGDDLGRCTLRKFIDSLDLDESGEKWDSCFASVATF